MKRALIVIGAIVGLAVVVIGVRYYLQTQRAKKAGILSESIVKQGDTWKVDFTARIPAAEKDVFGAIENVEDAPKYSSGIKDVKVLSKEDNKKTVEMQLEGGFGGQQPPLDMQFEYHPDQGKITSSTINNPFQQTTSEYDLKDEGGSTLIDYHQSTKIMVQLPVPEAVVKQFMRNLFIAQLEGIKTRLHVTTPEADEEEEKDEP